MTHWSVPYVGLPWQEKGASRAGVACWGLAILVYRELRGVGLPDYAGRAASLAERAEIAAIFADATAALPWVGVRPGRERDLDIAVFRCGGLDTHVGLVCGRGRMLHVTSGQESCIVPYDAGRWASRRAGIYRHVDLWEAGDDA